MHKHVMKVQFMLDSSGAVHQHSDQDFGTQELNGAGGPFGMVYNGGDGPYFGVVQDPSLISFVQSLVHLMAFFIGLCSIKINIYSLSWCQFGNTSIHPDLHKEVHQRCSRLLQEAPDNTGEET